MEKCKGNLPSIWVKRWSSLLKPHSRVLDLACGRGRNSLFLADLGHNVLSVDHDPVKLSAIPERPEITILCENLESGSWLFEGNKFDGIVVTNYLHRPILLHLVEALDSEGVFIYETFAQGNHVFGRPSNPDYLLSPHELVDILRGKLHIVGFEQGRVDSPNKAIIQRVCATSSPHRMNQSLCLDEFRH